jgi:hypothetical protein
MDSRSSMASNLVYTPAYRININVGPSVIIRDEAMQQPP